MIPSKMFAQTEYEKSLCGTNYALSYSEENGYVPCSPLDHVLAFKGDNIKIRFFSVLDGTEINKENLPHLCAEVKDLISNKKYPTTDHLFISTEINDTVFLYVSLDNSVRANINGFPLYKRIDKLCEVVHNCISSFGSEKNCVVFFSESCRSSFDGSDINNKINEMSWFKLRQKICHCCELEYLGECSNNDDSSCMSFGVSAFCTKKSTSCIDGVIPCRILTEGFGSGALGIKLISGEIIWGIHFPLDFKNTGPDNLGAKAMAGLVKVLTTYRGSILAMGDFNTIPGKIMQYILQAVPDNMELLSWNFPTFFGAFYDKVQPRDNEEWILI